MTTSTGPASVQPSEKCMHGMHNRCHLQSHRWEGNQLVECLCDCSCHTSDTPRASDIHFHAGHNMPGYLPESDVYTFETFEGAKLSTIDDIDRYGDYLFDCERHDDADESSAIMQDLNLESGPEWGAYIGDLYYWISPCTDDCDMEDM